MEISPKKKLFTNPLHPYSKALLSAVPKVKAKNQNKIIIKGDIPSPINPPSGCVFRTRCQHATEECSKIVPQLQEVDSDRKIACIREDVW